MKQSSSTRFTGIPLDTNTLAGQWMTFSHMANHYRKLLNVKPRVDTGLPPSHNHSSFHSISMQQQSSKGNDRRSKQERKLGCSSSKSKKSTNANSGRCGGKTNNSIYYNHHHDSLYSSHPNHLNTSGKTKSPSKSAKQKTLVEAAQPQLSRFHHPQEYQVMFGPSSIRSSTDAFMSDETESTMSNGKPPSEDVAPIGVTEKIRRFLNHIHQLDLTTSKPKRVTTAIQLTTGKPDRPVNVSGRKCGQQLPSSATTIGSAGNVDFRLSRHSKCFLPPEPKSPKQSTGVKAGDSFGNQKKSSLSNKYKGMGDSPSGTSHHFYSSKSPKKYFVGEDLNMLPEKDGSTRKVGGKSLKRGGSIESIGTICGSEELTVEDFLISSKEVRSSIGFGMSENHQRESPRMDDNQNKTKKVVVNGNASSRSIPQRHRHASGARASSLASNLAKSSSMSSLVPHTKHNHGTTAVNGTNNKDSSRDSAYGFSSGESRITTRESTPEKKYHHQFTENLQEKPCEDIRPMQYEQSKGKEKMRNSSNLCENQFERTRNNSRDSHRTKKLHNQVGSQTTKSSINVKNRNSPDRYITFLADITQDIVSKGIYTNKGLKNLFKSHLGQNKELDPERLADMLERLRMDLGIPKDDTLDKIEFGYGSVENSSSTAFFYNSPEEQKQSIDSVKKMVMEINPMESFPSTSTSPPTIVPTIMATHPKNTTTEYSSSRANSCSNRSSTTTEEGIDIVSVPSSDRDDNDKNEFDEDVLSLSESEVTQALKIAGLDEGTTEEVMGILNL